MKRVTQPVQDTFNRVASKLNLVRVDSAANELQSCSTSAMTAAIRLSSQRSRRREATRRNRRRACGPGRSSNRIPKLVNTSSAMTKRANNVPMPESLFSGLEQSRDTILRHGTLLHSRRVIIILQPLLGRMGRVGTRDKRGQGPFFFGGGPGGTKGVRGGSRNTLCPRVCPPGFPGKGWGLLHPLP